jgi:hypothetical protein
MQDRGTGCQQCCIESIFLMLLIPIMHSLEATIDTYAHYHQQRDCFHSHLIQGTVSWATTVHLSGEPRGKLLNHVASQSCSTPQVVPKLVIPSHQQFIKRALLAHSGALPRTCVTHYMPFHISVTAMDPLGPNSADFPALSIASLGTMSLMMQVRLTVT